MKSQKLWENNQNLVPFVQDQSLDRYKGVDDDDAVVVVGRDFFVVAVSVVVGVVIR